MLVPRSEKVVGGQLQKNWKNIITMIFSFKFAFFVFVCACNPFLFLDKGSIPSGSDVLEATTGEWSYDATYYSKSGSYTDVGNAQEMLTYAAGLQRTLLEGRGRSGGRWSSGRSGRTRCYAVFP